MYLLFKKYSSKNFCVKIQAQDKMRKVKFCQHGWEKNRKKVERTVTYISSSGQTYETNAYLIWFKVEIKESRLYSFS
jgi:hypothetical protein